MACTPLICGGAVPSFDAWRARAGWVAGAAHVFVFPRFAALWGDKSSPIKSPVLDDQAKLARKSAQLSLSANYHVFLNLIDHFRRQLRRCHRATPNGQATGLDRFGKVPIL